MPPNDTVLPLPRSGSSSGPRLFDFGAAVSRIESGLDALGQIGYLTLDFVRVAPQRPFGFQAVVDQFDGVGYRSLNVVCLTAIFSGMVLALQMGQFLARFGAKIYVSRVMGISLLRELGPVLTALIIGARVGAGISAEIGTMKVTDQIDAMRALGASPVKELVVPRVLATVLMLRC
jgi:phospholipid/cholesterol/gamma-HCH transport system permease protein